VRIVVVCMARNEADVIELFVRWQLRYADHVLVGDHASGDATGEILAALRDEGLPLTVARYDAAEQDQSRVTSELARRAAHVLAAEWVLPVDADEFLVTRAGGSARPVIEALDERLHHVDWRTFVPRPEDLTSRAPLFERITHRPESERTSHHKLLVPGSLLRRRGVRLSSGNHRVFRRTLGGRAKVPSVETDALWLAHFPLRSVEQLRAKVLVGWLARLASAEQHIDTRKNLHLEQMFERLREGGELGPEELAGFTRFYTLPEGEGESPKLMHAPLAPPGGPIELRYTAPERAGSLPALLDFAQRLATQTGAARARSLAWRARRLSGLWRG